MPDDLPFWKTTPLAEMTRAEWESLCDGCGRCCLHKFVYDDAPDDVAAGLRYTNVACRLLDLHSGACSRYPTRKRYVPDCQTLTPEGLLAGEFYWLPPTCGYRRIHEGKDLAWWHPLVSGDRETVHTAGISIRSRHVISERDAGQLDEHVVDWPGKTPRVRAPKKDTRP